ncbi:MULTISPECIES: hypothetical protein [Veillonella]|uniref:hypothetical protein n=1 Tax=Veillonella TaxID=29465 RepID=UPI0012EA4BE1|nr:MULTISPECIES: hypothetical protein [Veillonella]
MQMADRTEALKWRHYRITQYRRRRSERRNMMAPQLADIVEGFIFGTLIMLLVWGVAYWWVTGEALIRW